MRPLILRRRFVEGFVSVLIRAGWITLQKLKNAHTVNIQAQNCLQVVCVALPLTRKK